VPTQYPPEALSAPEVRCLTLRTLPMEVQISNQHHTLLPGMYAQVKFSVARAIPPLLVPATTLVVCADGPQMATVQPD